MELITNKGTNIGRDKKIREKKLNINKHEYNKEIKQTEHIKIYKTNPQGNIEKEKRQ